MKPPIILLLTKDPAVSRVAEDIVLRSRHGLRMIHSTRDAFRALAEGCDDVDLAIVDLDPGMHGSALLEATGDRLPVIALTSLEENYMLPVAAGHGALACLAKPITGVRLEQVIDELLPHGATALAAR